MGTNRLGEAGSAYLRSAAQQPVEWFPWGAEAFAAAAAADRPVLLDIGAVWCHWCHVMDAESYEDPALAAELNRHFICVKVDRDERPDVDARYQRAVQALTRQGGWPLTVFLTPQAEPFFGGTYFPPEPRQGMPSFRDVLSRVLAVWRDSRGRVEEQARALRELLTAAPVTTAAAVPGALALDDAVHRMLALADRVHGGFGTQPKFPHPIALGLLLCRCCDAPDPAVEEIVRQTLDGMARGGFRDLLGGGFHRYSVDAAWIIPHFEKLAADNAELLVAYADAAALFRDTGWRSVAGEVVRWIREVLADTEGGFAASQDADVAAGDDGSYFTWTRDELGRVLSEEDTVLAADHFGLGSAGRMPHDAERNVLFVASPAERLARERGESLPAVSGRLALIYQRLRGERLRRPLPFVDRTRYAGWNALLAGALLRAGPLLQDPWCTAAALAALRRLRDAGPTAALLAHAPGGPVGLLEDAVHCAAAALDAYEATGDPGWLHWSTTLMDGIWERHWDMERGGLNDRAPAPDALGLLTAPVQPVQDSPNASATGVAGQLLARLAAHTREPRWGERLDALLATCGPLAVELGLFAAAILRAADWRARPATHLLISGAAGDPLADALHQAALACFIPRRVVTRLTPESATGELPAALEAVRPLAGLARGYLCVGNRCLAPAASLVAWQSALRSVLPGSPEAKLHPAPDR